MNENFNKDLPCALSRIFISNFQGIKALTISDLPLNSHWIFLTGENGFGKTSILRAIAKGLVGDENSVEPLPATTTILLNAIINNKPFQRNATEKITQIMPIVAYGASRFRIDSGDTDMLERSKQVTYSLFKDDGLLINIERILIDAEQTKEKEKAKGINPTTFDKLRSVFLKIIPKLADIKVEYFEKETITNRFQVKYYEQSDNGEIYAPVKLNDLAAGYRSILTMVGDMIIRLSADPNNPLDDLKGIVLIDEIDAHLHPKYQYELPKLLSETFPNIQFIATTHSPIPLLSLPKTLKSVVLTVERTLDEGIKVNRIDEDIEIYRLNPNAILTSPIFGFEELTPPDTTATEMVGTDNFGDVERINDIKKRLTELRKQGVIQ
jgi:predicted ATP-dependent endonuclease of OLD family